MQRLSEAIETFTAAADRLDEAALRAARRAEARADGAEAQGDVILRLRGEIEALRRTLAGDDAAVRREKRPADQDERIEPFWAAG